MIGPTCWCILGGANTSASVSPLPEELGGKHNGAKGTKIFPNKLYPPAGRGNAAKEIKKE